MSSLNVNDILEEVLEENNRILNELLFAHKCIVKSLEFKHFIVSIARQFVDYLNPDLKKKYEDLSQEINHLIDKKLTNISDQSLNESNLAIKLEISDHSIESDSEYQTANEDNVTDEEESMELDVSQAFETKNMLKHFCKRCGNTYDFPEDLELHVQYCRTERQSVSSESQPEYNWSDIEEEKGEKEMVTEELVNENVVILDQGSDDEELIEEEILFENSVTDKPSVRIENISHKPMTRSSGKTVSGQQSSDSFNVPSKPITKQKCKPNSRGKKKPFPIKCHSNGCNAVFRKRKTLTAHIKKLHRLKCEFPGCDYQTEYKHRMKSHLKRKHSDDRPFECDQCHKKYKFNEALSEHMKIKHLDLYPDNSILVCDWNQCHFRTKSLRALNVHKCVHTLPFKCQICKKKFPFKNNMKLHLISKHKKDKERLNQEKLSR